MFYLNFFPISSLINFLNLMNLICPRYLMPLTRIATEWRIKKPSGCIWPFGLKTGLATLPNFLNHETLYKNEWITTFYTMQFWRRTMQAFSSLLFCINLEGNQNKKKYLVTNFYNKLKSSALFSLHGENYRKFKFVAYIAQKADVLILICLYYQVNIRVQFLALVANFSGNNYL